MNCSQIEAIETMLMKIKHDNNPSHGYFSGILLATYQLTLALKTLCDDSANKTYLKQKIGYAKKTLDKILRDLSKE